MDTKEIYLLECATEAHPHGYAFVAYATFASLEEAKVARKSEMDRISRFPVGGGKGEVVILSSLAR